MTIRLLWPRSGRDHSIEEEAVGEGIVTEFARGFEQVSEAQWRNCDGIVGVAPPAEYLPLLDKCRIVVKTAVGFDDVDIEAFGRLGIPVCNVPDYGTREVADHAIALMMTLVKSIAFHDEELRADPIGNWRPALNPYGRRLSACNVRCGGAGPHRHRRHAPRPSLRYGLRVLRPLPAEWLGTRAWRAPRGYVGRIDGPVRHREHPHAAERGDALPHRRRRLRRSEKGHHRHQHRARARSSI